MTSPAASDPLFLSFQLALAGRYSIDRELGRGGMGVVYLAREVHLDRMVAIKLLPPARSADSALRERFLREARLAAKLSHPSIIPIHAVDDAGGFVFYVMAFVDGETLAQRVRTRGPLSTSEAARVLRDVAWALAHAHSHGLVHRDVKPDNILLEFRTNRVLVADFGIAAATRDAAGEGVSGTPEFMSPEQCLGHAVDPRSDLYSLGVTAFYSLTGRLPFEGKSATEVLAKQVTEPPPRLASMGVPVSRKIASLVDRCLAKDPSQRPATCDAFADQLGVAIEQRREMPAALRAFVKRDARLNGAGTLLFAGGLLAGSIGVATYAGALAAFCTLAFGAVAGPFAYAVHTARKLMRLGFVQADIKPAFAAEIIEQARDDRAVDSNQDRSWLERVAGLAAYLSVWPFGLGVFAKVIGVHDRVFDVLCMTGFVTAPSTLLYLALLERHQDAGTTFWADVWTGEIGEKAFAVARRLLGRSARAFAVTHRATELSLGMAAESLFEALPSETRESLGDIVTIVRRLQKDAQRLRRLHDGLQEAVAAAGDGVLSPEYDRLRADGERVHTKLGAAVGALETIRLNLLRLHAGSESIEGVTTHLDLAAEVSAEVERMLAARKEVDRALAYPRQIAVTPV